MRPRRLQGMQHWPSIQQHHPGAVHAALTAPRAHLRPRHMRVGPRLCTCSCQTKVTRTPFPHNNGIARPRCASCTPHHHTPYTPILLARLSFGCLPAQALGGRFSSVMPSDLTKPGALAFESIPARADHSEAYAQPSVKRELARIFKRDGCHHCGTRARGVRSWVGVLMFIYLYKKAWVLAGCAGGRAGGGPL